MGGLFYVLPFCIFAEKPAEVFQYLLIFLGGAAGQDDIAFTDGMLNGNQGNLWRG